MRFDAKKRRRQEQIADEHAARDRKFTSRWTCICGVCRILRQKGYEPKGANQ